MILKKKTKYRPLYKKFIRLRNNIQFNKKILKFKKKKWRDLLKFTFPNYKKYKNKPYTLHKFKISVFASQGNSFKKKYRNDSSDIKKFKIFYGNLLKKRLKKYVSISKQHKNANSHLIEIFESKLDTVLFRSWFSPSIRKSRQMINHGYVTVNKKIIKKPSYILKKGDLIEISSKYHNILKQNLKTKRLNPWFWPKPIPPSYLIIKYKTMQIIFGDITNFNFSNYFPFLINPNSVLTSKK